ncbi:propionyl-CoA synthetase [uncultured Sneathiella sp.]|uniref:propionyl-CoA synthetase n=1 Tax=uncultured Sneathiella sp. TaxID=879315 RepID=UPI0030ED209B|tara:strand:- start:16201 stop:18102 length:1902 start_codon:yes stop_codon:yes gene_type:complete
MTSYEQDYQQSLKDPEAFWGKVAEGISWSKPWDRVLNSDNPPFYRWFEGAEMNTCYNCLDRHVEEGRGDQDALIYDSPMTGQVVKFTYREFTDIVARFAGALASRGIKKGDRVLIYMPMVPEAAVAMLACARIGAIHSVVFGGFAPKELATRIDDAKPVAIVAASCGLEPGRTIAYKPLIDDAINLSTHKPSSCIVLQRPECEADLSEERDCDWQELAATAEPASCVPVAATDPLYILYTSGTTGIPKGVVRDNGGHAVALRWSMKHVYDINPGDVFWAASDVGWVVGHSYIVYAPLLHGCTTILYEGKPVGTPDAGVFWRVIQDHKVKALFTAPTAFRAIRQQDPEGKLITDYDLSQFVTLFLAGERADPDTIIWAQEQLQVPVIDHWWQTETGWAIGANCMGYGMKPVKLGSPTLPVPGYDIRIIDEKDGKTEMARGDIGVIAVKLPLPPGSLPTLWQNDEGFVRSYMADIPGYYKTGDAGYIDEDGYLFIMARTDDIINVAGHRLSTGGMEEVLAGHPDVAESAVMGVQDQLKGQVPVGFVVLNAGVNRPEEEIQKELVALVREKIGPVAAFKIALVVKRLPKTRSGKILRAVMRKIADGEPYNAPATIDDPAILTEITEVLTKAGYPVK